MFVGEYDRSVDGNGRLALPSAFRDELGDRCYVTRDPSGHLAVTSVGAFEADAAALLAKVERGELPSSAVRNFGVNSMVLAVDKQGRITLDDESRRHAGLVTGGTVKIAGAIKHLEIWRPSRFATVRNEDDVQQPVRRWDDESDEAADA